jgi:hypothetical protein
VSLEVPHLSDIEQDLRNAFKTVSEQHARAKSEAEQKLPQIELIPFRLCDGSTEIVAIDGSYSPLFRTGSIWIVAVRAVALTYEFGVTQGYRLKGCDVNEAAQLVTTDRAIASQVGGFTAELQSLTARGKARSEAPARMARYSRILRELELAAWVAKRRERITIVLDGTFSVPPHVAIKTKMEETIDACEQNGNSLVGISKDSNAGLFGCSIGDEDLLQNVKQEGLLYVVPPQPRRTTLGPQGTTYFARYHPEAPKWFRTDIISPQVDPAALFGRLAQFARSQICLGYVYPLIEAHRAVVELRKYPKLYDDLLFRVAADAGLDAADVVWGRTNVEGKRRDAFHAYLDLISKTGGRKK